MTPGRLIPALIAATLLVCAGAARAADLTVAFSIAKPPFVFQTQAGPPAPGDQPGGVELDIMAAALAAKGHRFTPTYVTYGELTGEVTSGRADAAATVRPENPALHYSDEFVRFHNFAIMGPGVPAPAAVADLSARRMVAWQGATKDLGAAFAAVAAKAPGYAEMGDQKEQVRAFLEGRFDTLIIDGTIFRYWARVMGRKADDFRFHALFGSSTAFTVGFANKDLRDDFNTGLRALKAQGAYDALFRKYLAD